MNYKVIGTIISGNSIGRHIGFPTANIALDNDTSIRDGVYAGVVTAEGSEYPALVNVGHKPSIGHDLPRTLEVHLLGFSGDLYGKTVEVILLEYIREEIKFGAIDELRLKIEEDRHTIEDYFRNHDRVQ